MRWLLVLLALHLALFPHMTAQARTDLSLSVEAGPELDTNAHRIQPLIIRCNPGEICKNGVCCTDDITCDTCRACTVDEQGQVEEPLTAGLMRLSGSARLVVRAADRHVISLGLSGGGKAFMSDEAGTADEVVQRADLGWGVQLSSLLFSVSGTYYDAFQRLSQRDFRTGTGLARLTLGREGLPITVSSYAGYRGFHYKPLSSFSFHALTGGLELRSQLTSGPADELVEWNLSLSYTVASRYFDGGALGLPERELGDVCGLWQPLEKDPGREDLNHVLRAEVRYLGNAEVSLWYLLELNQSNSYGESFTRHALGLRFTTPLAWELFLTVKGVLQFSSFVDPFFSSPTANVNLQTPEGLFTIDDENRSRLELILSRDLTERLALMVRYGLYVNESISHTRLPQLAELKGFKRQTFFTGLRFEYDL
jgi:hypothetical protein